MAKATAAAAAVAIEVARVAEVVANVDDTLAIRVSNVADVVALAFVSARTDTALMRVSNVADVLALAKDVPILAMLVAIVADTAAILVSSVADVPTLAFVASLSCTQLEFTGFELLSPALISPTDVRNESIPPLKVLINAVSHLRLSLPKFLPVVLLGIRLVPQRPEPYIVSVLLLPNVISEFILAGPLNTADALELIVKPSALNTTGPVNVPPALGI